MSLYPPVPYGQMNNEQKAVYGLYLYAQSINDLWKVHIEQDFFEHALKGAVASSSLDKTNYAFSQILDKNHYARGDTVTRGRIAKNVIRWILWESSHRNVNEDHALQMIQAYIKRINEIIDLESKKEVDIKSPIPYGNNISVLSIASKQGFYKIAEYLLDEGFSFTPIDHSELANSMNNSKNHLEHLKWQLDHGNVIDKQAIGRVLCCEHLVIKVGTYNAQEKEEVKNTLRALNVQEIKISKIEANCPAFADVIGKGHDALNKIIKKRGDDDVLNKYLKLGAELHTIEFLIENDVPIFEHHLQSLVSHNNPEASQLVINTMRLNNIVAHDKNSVISAINNHYENCENNKIIAEYLGVTGEIDLSACEYHYEL